MDGLPTELVLAAAQRLRVGGVVAFPTETVYGLGADALNPVAVAEVYELKGRPTANPLIVHVSGPEMARTAVSAWPDAADRLARAFWPGPLSLVLPKHDRVPAQVTARGPSVAVRCPDHPVALALLFEFAGPIVGPSANLSGQVSPTTSAHVRESFDEARVMVLDGGPCRAGIESTVVSLLALAGGGRPRILRPGVIGAEQLSEVLGAPVDPPASPAAPVGNGAALSPGLLGRHYAPRTPVVLFDEPQWPTVLDQVNRPVVVLARRARHLPDLRHAGRLITMPAEPEAYAARLYAALREADAAGAAVILVERPPPPEAGPVWHAIADRLNRAAARADD